MENSQHSFCTTPTTFDGLIVTGLFVVMLVSFSFSSPAGELGHNDLFLTQEELSSQNFFLHVPIQAESAYVLDVNSGKVLFEKNSEKIVPLASLTKVMTAVTAQDIFRDTKVIAVGDGALQTEGDSGLFSGEEWRFRDLLDFSLLVSSNDAANAVASAADAVIRDRSFIEEMNYRAQEIGLENTHFLNESGLDTSDVVSGAYGNAKDVASLFTHILSVDPDLLEVTRTPSKDFTSLQNITHEGENTNPYTNVLPVLLGSKTGFTELSGGNLAVTINPDPNRPIVIVVLGSTIDGRFDDVKLLSDRTLDYLLYYSQ
jgi:serine-type D-Ala-D-Ala carboxypeptidase (penicillin-binding protein 5/6)